MKRIMALLFSLIAVTIPCRAWGQSDSLRTSKETPVFVYLGIGGGLNNRGGNMDMSFTLTSGNGMGGSIHFMPAYSKLKDVPDDYYEGFLRFSTPAHNLEVLSLNFVKKFSNAKGTFRFGLEAGPSWGWFDLVELRLNPDYPDLLEYKYDKIRTKTNGFGFSLAIRADFPFTRFFGCDVSIFTNLNSNQNFVGIDFSFIMGMLRARK